MSFVAELAGDAVELEWTTASEVNNFGFDIERSRAGTPDGWWKIGFIPGHGTSLDRHSYSFIDKIGASGYLYRLKQIDLDNKVHYTNAVSPTVSTGIVESIPLTFSMSQNYPNPFNPTTHIAYEIPPGAGSGLQVVGSGVRLAVYDLLGREVAVLVDGVQSPGRHEVVFDARNLASGVYVYRLTAGAFSASKKMTIVR
jgi:hypothetical protein